MMRNYTFRQSLGCENTYKCLLALNRMPTTLLNNASALCFVFPLGWTDTPGGCPAGCGRRRPLRWRQHTRCRTQDPGPRACQGTAEAEQAGYPGHLRRSHPATGSRWTRFNYYCIACSGFQHWVKSSVCVPTQSVENWLHVTWNCCRTAGAVVH